MSPRQNLYAALPFVAVLILGGVVGWVANTQFGGGTIFHGSVLRDDNSGYSLIDPILACDIGPEDAFPELNPVKATITKEITTEKNIPGTGSISVYVRLLKSGKWFEINGNQTYAPASLLKVFVMVAYYKENEGDTSVLTKQIPFEGSVNPVQDDPGEVIPHLTSGKLYSVSDIVKQMIVYSDNDALNTLVDNFDPQTLEAFNGIFTDLNIPSPSTQKESALNFMSVSEYSTVFRALFSATYLSRADSEKALDLLSQVQYLNGIVAGLPDSVTVAHKFGVTTIPQSGATPAQNELHDCGIVYYPAHPYLLCVMTQGTNFSALQTDLQDISRTTYGALDQYYISRTTATSTPVR